MSFHAKLLLTFAAVVGLTGVGAGMSLWVAARVQAAATDLIDGLLPVVEETHHASRDLAKLRESFRLASVEGDRAALGRTEAGAVELERTLAHLGDLSGDRSVDQAVELLHDYLARSRSVAMQLLAGAELGTVAADLAAAQRSGAELERFVERFREARSDELTERVRTLHVAWERARAFSVGALAVSVALALGLAFAQSGALRRSLRLAGTLARAMADGDLTTRLEAQGQDELAVLLRALDAMRGQLGNTVSEIIGQTRALDRSSSELAELSRALTVRGGEMSARATNATSRSHELRERVRTLAQGAHAASRGVAHTATSIHQISASLTQIGSGATDLAARVRDVASGIEEMTASLGSVADGGSSALATARSAAGYVAEASEALEELIRSAEAIQRVTEAIGDVAEQTNLLALNARIEAAAAGESGRSFAVVAGEVKQLAADTADATEGIRTLISAVRERAGLSRRAMQQVVSVMGQIETSSAQIADSVTTQRATCTQIASSISDAAGAASQISSTVNEISVGTGALCENAGEVAARIEEISDGVADFSSGVDEMGAAVDELGTSSEAAAQAATRVDASSERLARLASTLRAMVSRFQVSPAG